MITENLSTLKINKLVSEEQFKRIKDAEAIDPSAMYLTPDPDRLVVELVEIDDTTATTSHTAEQIYNHISNGGSVVAKLIMEGIAGYLTLNISIPTGAVFYQHNAHTGGVYIVELDSSGTAIRYYYEHITPEQLEEKLSEFRQSALVGERTADSGEIFNDYETNEALAPYAHVFGTGSRAGGRGYKLISVKVKDDLSEATITVDDNKFFNEDTEKDGRACTTYVLTEEEKAKGLDHLTLCFDGTKHYYDLFKIKSMTSNTDGNTEIIVVPTDTSPDAKLPEEKYFKFDSSTDDPWENWVWVVERPYAGEKAAFSRAAVAEGEDAIAMGRSAYAVGREVKAIGNYAHAEGRETLAKYLAHAEGLQTSATGFYSHAEGSYAKSSGECSHAEGRSTIASAANSHAEGNTTKSEGVNSHAEGKYTIALGESSHAEGMGRGKEREKCSIAEGTASHVEGIFTYAKGIGAHAEGSGNVDSKKYLQALGDYSHAEGFFTEAGAEAAHTEGNQTKASGKAAHAEGHMTEVIAEYAHVEGYSTKAGITSYQKDANGNYLDKDGNITTDTSQYVTVINGIAAHAEGYETTATGNYSHTEGIGTKATKDAAHAEGEYTSANALGAHAEGACLIEVKDDGSTSTTYTKAEGVGSHAEGLGTIAKENGSHAEGGKTKATKQYSHAEGYYSEATKAYAHAEGYNTKAYNGEAAHAEGYETHATAKAAHAEGERAKARGRNSHAEGQDTLAAGRSSHAEGQNTEAGRYKKDADGNFLDSKGNVTTDITKYAVEETGQAAHAEGYCTKAYGDYSHAEGKYTIAAGENQHVQGQYNIKDDGENDVTPNGIGQYAHIIGGGTSTSNCKNIHTVDWTGKAWYAGDVIASSSTGVNISLISTYTTAANKPGRKVTNGGEVFNYSANIASGLYSHAEGRVTNAKGENSHAEGYGENTITSTMEKTIAISLDKAKSLHQATPFSLAYGKNSHTEGTSTLAWASAAHAEGYRTIAGFQGSHAEGGITFANNSWAHAEGYYTEASGTASHAEGFRTQANGTYQHVQGRYNIVDTTSAHIVGNGYVDDAGKIVRKNAHTLDWAGNAWFAGAVKADLGIVVSYGTAEDRDAIDISSLEDGTIFIVVEDDLEIIENIETVVEDQVINEEN